MSLNQDFNFSDIPWVVKNLTNYLLKQDDFFLINFILLIVLI